MTKWKREEEKRTKRREKINNQNPFCCRRGKKMELYVNIFFKCKEKKSLKIICYISIIVSSKFAITYNNRINLIINHFIIITTSEELNFSN